MARFTFSLNGALDLEPVSFDKVDKFYTMQNEFLRDTAVLTSTSRYSEILHLATFAFDVSKQEDVDKLTRALSICRSFPYVFIKSNAIYDKHLDPMNLSIGSGYFMYAIHEYEVEMNSSDSGQGVAMLSMRLQMVNWRPLTREIKFINVLSGKTKEQIEEEKKEADKRPKNANNLKDISSIEVEKNDELPSGQIEFVLNPEESNLLHTIMDFYNAKVEKYSKDLHNAGMKKSFEFNLGYPFIVESKDKLDEVKEGFVWGTYKTFRIMKTVSTSGTGSLPQDGSGSTKAESMSEIPEGTPNRWDEESRVYVGWIRERVAGTAVKDGGVALQSIVVRKRNRFANQTIQGFKYPYAQYLGGSPAELLVSTVVNHEQGMSSGTVMAANSKITSIQNAQDMANRTDVAFPSLKGLNVLAVENPLANAMGLEFVILDSSHASTAGTANNVLIHNHTFIESNSQEMVDRSKYVRSNKVDEWNDSVNQGSRLLYLINKKVERDATGSTDKALNDIVDKINRRVLNAVNNLIEQDKEDNTQKVKNGNLVKDSSFIAGMVNHPEWKKKSDTEKTQLAIGWYIHYDNQKSVNGVEERLKDEHLRKLRSAVEYGYRDAYLSDLSHSIVINGLHEDIQKQEEWMAKNNGIRNSMGGEGIPDLHYEEIYGDLPATVEYPTWKELPVIPFIYDVGIYDGRKILGMWEQMRPHIDEMFKSQSELIQGDLSTAFTSVAEVKEKVPTGGAESVTQEPNGAVTEGKAASKDKKGAAANADIEVKEDVNAKLSNMPGGWLPLMSVGASGTLGSRFGMRLHPVDKVWKMHQGVDVRMPQGTTLFAAASGRVTRATYNAGGYGGVVYIDHGNGIETRYGHMNVINVKAGQSIQKGQVIGKSGGAKGTRGAGKSTGPHLHYETRVNGKAVDPVKFHRSANGKYTPSMPAASEVTKQADTKANISREIKDSTKSKVREAVASSGSNTHRDSLKSFIVSGETKGNYNLYNVNGSGGKKGLGRIGSTNLTDMTIDQIRAKNGPAPGQWWAVGKYQTVPDTFEMAVKGLGLSGSTKMTPEVQERIGTWLIFNKRPKLRAYLRGESNDLIGAHDELSLEWASVVGPNGKGKYRYDRVNKDHTPAMVQAMLKGAREAYLAAKKAGKSEAEAQNIATGTAMERSLSNAESLGVEESGKPDEALKDLYDKVATQRTADNIGMNSNPTPWVEEIQAVSRIENMVKDLHYGIEKLIPTYKVYIVHGNNENSLLYLIDHKVNASYYEIPSVRNLRIEMANQENPVAVASFEVMNPLNTSSDPKEMKGNRNTAVDLTALGSEEAQIIVLDMLRLKAGNKIQIRMGYSNDPNDLPIIFNGLITESDGGEVLHIVAEGYGRELQNEIIFAGDIIGSTMFMSDNDNKYISAAVARIVKSAKLQHFGKNSKWFKDADDYQDISGIHMESMASQNVGDSGLKGDSPIWNSHIDTYFKYDVGGPTDALENFWLMNVDQADRFFINKWYHIFPFSLHDMFPDFHIMNKTVWDVISTGRRLFPSSISLIKNMDSRCTIFTGIKEQMILGSQKQHTLASSIMSGVVRNRNNNNKERAAAGLTMAMTPGAFYHQSPSVQNMADLEEEKRKHRERDKIKSMEILQKSIDSQASPDDSWVPATNFHVISDSHNLISNQLKVNQSCITAISVAYGDDPKEFSKNNAGNLNIFEMKANGGLFPAFTKQIFHADSSLSSLGMAVKTGQGVLLEELEKMYDGVVIINGNPMVAPGDYAYIQDDLRQMSGVIKCREVQHVFTEYDGYITIITPGMFVEPATHLYSALYMKFGVFASYIATAISQYRLVTTTIQSNGSIFNPSSIAPTKKDSELKMVGLFAGGAAMATGLAASTFAGAKYLFSGFAKGGKVAWGLASKIQTPWVQGIMQKATMFNSSIGSRFAASLTRLKPIYDGIRFATIAARAGGGVAGIATAIGAWTAIISVIAVAVWGFTKAVYEAWKTKMEMRHRALLKMPVKVYGQEYTAGLFGWNDELSIVGLQLENVKRTINSVKEITKAASASEANGGDEFRILYRIMTD